MALDYAQAAKEALEAVGGKDNIVSAAHCATRLRLVIADNDKIDKEKLENAVGAKGNFEASGQSRSSMARARSTRSTTSSSSSPA